MSIFDRVFGRSVARCEAPPSTPVMPSAYDIEVAKRQQAAFLADYKMLIQMGMGQSPSAYKPPPPPKVKHVGGDHPWHDWSELDEEHGPIPGVLYKDIFIPVERINRIIAGLYEDRDSRREWSQKSIDEKKEYIYLEARKLMIVE